VLFLENGFFAKVARWPCSSGELGQNVTSQASLTRSGMLRRVWRPAMNGYSSFLEHSRMSYPLEDLNATVWQLNLQSLSDQVLGFDAKMNELKIQETQIKILDRN
jgi:hypothetical protein